MRGGRRALFLSLAVVAAGVAVAWTLRRRDAAPAPEDARAAEAPPTPSPRLATGANPARAPDTAAAPAATAATATSAGRLTGRVTSAGGGPVVGARVRVTLQRGEVVEEIGQATSRPPEGAYEVDLARLAARATLERAAGRLFAHASAKGYRPDSGSIELPAAETSGPVVANLELKPGRALRGRVVREGSAAVAGVYVVLTTGADFGGSAYTDAEGRYELGLDAGGSGRLTATASSIGAGAASVDLGGARDVDAPDLTLHGTGTIDGTVRYASGAPVARLRVRASASAGESGPDDEPYRDDPDEGLVRTIAETDATGHFHLGGLRPGRYLLTSYAGPIPPFDPAGPFETGEREARIEVALQRLVLRVRDADGRPLPGTSYSLRWEGADDGMAAGSLLRADGLLDVWGTPGMRVHAAAHPEGFPPAETVATMAEGRDEVTVDLTPSREVPRSGRIRIAVSDPAGTAIQKVLVKVETEPGGSTVLYEETPDGTGLLPPLPAGRYRLMVTPGRGARSEPPLEMFLPIETPVEVREGAETPVSLRARLAGRVRMTVRLGAGVTWPAEGVSVVARPRAGGDVVHLGGWVTVTAGGWTLTGLAAGEPAVSMVPLEPGAYEVLVRGKGLRASETAVSVDPGKIVDVDVTLAPAPAAGK